MNDVSPVGQPESRNVVATNLYARMEAVSPVGGFVVSLIAGLSLLALSFALDLDHLDRKDLVLGKGSKEVGFASAPNWAHAYCCLFPLALFSLFSSFRNVRGALKEMARNGMFVDRHWQPLTEHQVSSHWTTALTHASKYLVWLMAFAVARSLGEWFVQSARPLWVGELPDGFAEPDWSVKYVHGDCIMRVANGAFSLAAFSLQAVATAALAAYVVAVVALIQFSETMTDGEDLRIVPDPDSEDPRKGFERLEPALIHIFHVGLLAFGMLFTSRYWNAYLLDDAEDLWSFAKDDLTLGLARGPRGSLAWIADMKINFVGGSSAFVGVVGLVVAVTVFVLPAVFLKNGAARARAVLLRHARTAGTFRGHTRSVLESSLRDMTLWPSNYVSSPVLALVVLFAGACLAIYQLMPMYAGAVLASVIVLVWKKGLL